MRKQLLLSAQGLHAAQKNQPVLLVDCRFDLSDPAKGYSDYLNAHIPGAVYAHLDNDLSNPVTGDSGRHPLPDADRFAGFLARSGWQAGISLVAYDDAGGSIAARLWWLMKYFGHDDALLLDGGLPAWKTAGYGLESGQVHAVTTAAARLKVRDELAVSTTEIIKGLPGKAMVLADVRAAERFNGEIEPIDSVAGHIPGAINYPFQLSLAPDGRFKPVSEVREALLTLQVSHQANDLVFMCGSGVTACHTIFAAELAGIMGSRLYAGSWSEWIRDSSRPVEPGII